MRSLLLLNYKRQLAGFVLSVIFLVFATACASIQLVSDYDAETDKALTALQRKIETLFVKLESRAGTEAAKYDKFTAFYEDVQVDLSALEMRNAIRPKNDLTIKQIGLLKDSINKMEELHKIGISAPEMVQPIRDTINTSLRAMLKLELAKKRGEKK